MNNILMIEKSQAFDDGIAEASDEAQTESLVIVLLDKLVEV